MQFELRFVGSSVHNQYTVINILVPNEQACDAVNSLSTCKTTIAQDISGWLFSIDPPSIARVWFAPATSPQKEVPPVKGFLEKWQNWQVQLLEVQECIEQTLCKLVKSDSQGTSPWCSSSCPPRYAHPKWQYLIKDAPRKCQIGLHINNHIHNSEIAYLLKIQ